MDEAWEKAVEAKLEGLSTSSSELRVLNLDGAVKSLHGCLPPAFLLERFPGLEHLSIANVGAPSLERFARLRNLQRLILSDNRIAGGLENLVDAGLESLRDLDLSNNRIQRVEDLAPLASLQLVSLDLYECPVTRVRDYRSRVFSMIRSLRYLDKLDANENERPESDDDEEEVEEEEDEEEEEEEDGSGEVDGGDRDGKMSNGDGNFVDGEEGIVDADEDEGSDADEEGVEIDGRTGGGLSNGFGRVVEDEEEDEDDLGEEIDEDEADFEVNVSGDDDDEFRAGNEAEMHHHVLDSEGEGDDGVDEEEIDEEEFTEDDDDDDEFRVEGADAEPANLGRVGSAEGEIDGHEHGEEDENGEIGEEDEQGAEVRSAEDEDYGDSEDEIEDEYLVQPIARSRATDSSVGTLNQASSSQSDANKRRKDEEGHLDDDKTEESRPSKRR